MTQLEYDAKIIDRVTDRALSVLVKNHCFLVVTREELMILSEYGELINQRFLGLKLIISKNEYIQDLTSFKNKYTV